MSLACGFGISMHRPEVPKMRKDGRGVADRSYQNQGQGVVVKPEGLR